MLPALRRGFEILELLARNEAGLGFNRIQEHFPKVTAATLTRLLKVLQSEELIEVEPVSRCYRLSGRTHSFAHKVLNTIPKERMITEALTGLASQTGESAAFFGYDGSNSTLLAKHEPEESFHYMDVGRHNNNFGKHAFAMMALAHLDVNERKKVIKGLEQPLEPSLSDFMDFLDIIKLEKVLVNTQDDKEGIMRVVSPVFEGGRYAGTIGISFFAARLDTSRRRFFVEKVSACAEKLTSELA